MKIFSVFIFIVMSNLSVAGMKSLMGSMHGDKMGVEYQVLNTGKHVLTVEEKIGLGEKNAKFKQLQVVDLNIKPGEYVSLNMGFRCSGKNDNFVYGVISKKHAKKNESFAPERAWEVDEKKFKLIAITDAKSISCKWSPEGESGYPFD